MSTTLAEAEQAAEEELDWEQGQLRRTGLGLRAEATDDACDELEAKRWRLAGGGPLAGAPGSGAGAQVPHAPAAPWAESEVAQRLIEAGSKPTTPGDIGLGGLGGTDRQAGGGMEAITAAAVLSKLHEAARWGDQLALCDCLASKSITRKNIDTPTDDGYAAVHFAARRGDVAVLRLLVNQGADPMAERTVDGATPLWTAASHGHLGAVRYLVGERGVSVEGGVDSGQSLSTLGAACFGRHLDIIKYLLEECKCSPDGWVNMACYGRLEADVAQFVLDRVTESQTAAAGLMLRSRVRKLEYGVSTIKSQLEGTAGREAHVVIETAALEWRHRKLLHLVERCEGTPVDLRGLVKARQLLAFAAALEQGRLACWDVVVQFLKRKKLGKRVAAFKRYGLWTIDACRALAYDDPYGVLTKIFKGTKKNKSEHDYEGYGKFKANIKECKVVELLRDEKLKEMFNELDDDGSGKISKAEMAELVNLVYAGGTTRVGDDRPGSTGGAAKSPAEGGSAKGSPGKTGRSGEFHARCTPPPEVVRSLISLLSLSIAGSPKPSSGKSPSRSASPGGGQGGAAGAGSNSH